MKNTLLNYVSVYREWWRLHGWLMTRLSEQDAADVASRAAAQWFAMACAGEKTDHGPYAELYQHALAIGYSRMRKAGSPEIDELEHEIPLPGEEISCDVARLYTVFYMLAHHGEWTTADQMLLRQKIVYWTPSKLDGFALAASIMSSDDAMIPLRCAVEASEGHTCGDDKWCAQGSELWRREDQLSQQWLLQEFYYRQGVKWQG